MAFVVAAARGAWSCNRTSFFSQTTSIPTREMDGSLAIAGLVMPSSATWYCKYAAVKALAWYRL